jgi:hypothetical protein
MMFAIARAFVLPIGLRLPPGSNDPSQFSVDYICVVGDGIKNSEKFTTGFDYNATLTAAANLTAFKSSIVAHCAEVGFTVTAANIIIFTGIQ